MTTYCAIYFKKAGYDELSTILERFDFPIAKFTTTMEQFACLKEIPCCFCGSIIDDVYRKEDENEENMYCFANISNHHFGKLKQEMVSWPHFIHSFDGKNWHQLLENVLRITCKECRKKLSEFNEERKAHNNSSMASFPATEFKKMIPVRYITKPQDPERPSTSKPIQTVFHYQGDFNMLTNNNPEYHWTKCKLCLRILRTTRADTSRMKTLQTSHARNHVSQMQYCCRICSYACRFHGGIQLHMNRTHPDNLNAYIDRAKDKAYKDEIADMVATCFGTEVKSFVVTRNQKI